MLRLNLTNNVTTQESLYQLASKSVSTLFVLLLMRANSIRLSFISLSGLLIALSLSHTVTVNASKRVFIDIY